MRISLACTILAKLLVSILSNKATSKATINTETEQNPYTAPVDAHLLDTLAYIWRDDNDMFNKGESRKNQSMLSQDKGAPSDKGGRVCYSNIRGRE